ncbi:DUF3568 domain-containing protein [Francisella tularensis subsp. novicida]|uniref:DUF3568 domain-containing protein n=2 Tax=Francisella tularensis TaxID=263 RepID=A0A6I4RTL7_FRATU|nr:MULTISPECIES: DUF3568 domain-containing protein [Francisella]ABK90586.1 protein of unknown function [Francisella tularensis subsp. novicida U112]AEE88155.1 hypothetical protein FNFX1_1770 [Francisella cf. novicida Fx1]AJI61915.1 hypothetical protein AW25_253 [Francisella tularensis subsp. novicida U112]APA83906.1 hypothetical protein N894_1922 [Francisella tularensis subsp. novicida PA10-7858]AVC43511.1 hypothetical protein B4919_01245 [Francisella tularensis subsp. novicida]
MKLRKVLIATLLGASALSLSSCWLLVGAAVGGGTAAYISGEYSMNMSGSVKDIYNATLKAVQSNDDFVITKKSITSVDAVVDGSTKVDSTSFYVKIEKLTDNASKVTIKFGTFGDQAMSATLMDQIQKSV